MISLSAFGSLELAQGAIVFVFLLLAYRAGKRDGRADLQADMAERRAQRRAEARMATLGRHRLAPFPDLEHAERSTDTGELRALTAAAETGDLAEIGRQNAAFFRRLDLKRWVRAS